MQGMHSKMDVNNDGKVSMAEVLRFSAEMRKQIAQKDVRTVLEEMDGDKDGKLSLPELLKDMDQWGEGGEEEKKEAEGRKELEKQKFKAADANGDGLIEEKELPALFYPETHEGVLEITAKFALAQKDTNGDGMLTMKEFWEGDQVEGEELSVSDEEKADFANLDKDGNKMLDVEELKVWESGHFHTEEAMKKLFDLADKDSDMHVTAEELGAAREQIAGSDAQYHLMEWAEHSEL
mmetsp:Transcript_19454/g.61199  ORF Transcript_19454/g.61199 Transcript_19454/m.61199 type:complete len:236 (-) Transcript_19454:97-804(-)